MFSFNLPWAVVLLRLFGRSSHFAQCDTFVSKEIAAMRFPAFVGTTRSFDCPTSRLIVRAGRWVVLLCMEAVVS